MLKVECTKYQGDWYHSTRIIEPMTYYSQGDNPSMCCRCVCTVACIDITEPTCYWGWTSKTHACKTRLTEKRNSYIVTSVKSTLLGINVVNLFIFNAQIDFQHLPMKFPLANDMDLTAMNEQISLQSLMHIPKWRFLLSSIEQLCGMKILMNPVSLVGYR